MRSVMFMVPGFSAVLVKRRGDAFGCRASSGKSCAFTELLFRAGPVDVTGDEAEHPRHCPSPAFLFFLRRYIERNPQSTVSLSGFLVQL